MERAVVRVSSLFYDIIYIVIGMILYSVIVLVGYMQSVKIHKKAYHLLNTLKEVIEEIKHIIIKEENEVDKGNYKNTRSSESTESQITFVGDAKERVQAQNLKNSLTLTDLLTRKATDEEYQEIIALLTKLAKMTYADFKFFIAKSPDETKDSNFVQIVSSSKERPDFHKLIFGKAVSYGIDMKELQQRFAEHVAAGNVIDLGEETVVILNDGSPQLPTGVSPINNGLEGGEIAFIISFIKKENLEAFNKNNLPQEGTNE